MGEGRWAVWVDRRAGYVTKLVLNLPAIQIIKAQENKIPVCTWKRTLAGILKCTRTKEGQIYLIKTWTMHTGVKTLII